MNIKIFLAFWS